MTVTAPARWLNANDRHGHWAQRSGPTREWREAAAWTARAAKVPGLQRASITAVVRRADRRTDTDAQNRYPTIKAAVDGLVDAGVLPDDKDQFLLALTIRPGAPVSRREHPRGVLELIITEEALVARIRTLKPGFFRSRSLAKNDPLARLTFAGMWTEADDHGRGVADPRLIKGAIWALDDNITHLHVSAHINMLAATDHIILSRVGDETYFQVVNWEPHQSAAFRRGTPQYPPVSAGQVIESLDSTVCMQESASRTQEGAGEGRREEGTGKREREDADASGALFDEPAPPKKKASRKKPEVPLPDDFTVTGDMRAWAAENTPGVDIERATLKFRNHAAANDRRQRDWPAAWRNWMLNERPSNVVAIRSGGFDEKHAMLARQRAWAEAEDAKEVSR
ncbi:hypothetical protein [Glycomyces paridis]|uniref:Uncharacterized protein n=1 Tax=Glycomyces paridis TaxID=2126555 RepID=A0A4S8P8I0_9ACTN|nr:hypothetical protein [Glycomyces paridis]THV25981.1 hypothetical protein E9998_19805 [Glycomyces paridis]